MLLKVRLRSVSALLRVSASPIARPPPLPQRIERKVEQRERSVKGQRLSYRPHCPIPQRIVIKSELREGGVEGQRLSYRPPSSLPQAIVAGRAA